MRPRPGIVVWWRLGAALLVAVGLQVGVNLANDAFDGMKGVDTADRVGPPRLTQTGAATPRAVLVAALASIAVAGFAGLALAIATSPALILVVGALAIVAALLYSGGPRPYAGLGLGELMVFVFFGLVATCGTSYVMVETIPASAWWCGAAMGLLAVAILEANNIRDIATDAVAGKRTLAVRIGDRAARTLYAGLIVAAFVDARARRVRLSGLAQRRHDAVGPGGAGRLVPRDHADRNLADGDGAGADPRAHRDREAARRHGCTAHPGARAGDDGVVMGRGDVSLACATALVDALAGGGVQHACLSPGSRSTPLALALARDERITVHVHLDERSAAFFALGIASATDAPVAIACTSGTAATEYLPAIVEASQSRRRLVALTADRPPRLRGTGANQTIDQAELYGRYARSYLEPPVPGDDGDAASWFDTGLRALTDATRPPAGPVHVNCCFEEPTVPDGEATWSRRDAPAVPEVEHDPDAIGAALDASSRATRVAAASSRSARCGRRRRCRSCRSARSSAGRSWPSR